MITKIGDILLGVGHLRGVIFDLDGTLADTGGDLIEAANATFRHLGHGNVLDPASDAAVAMQTGGRAMLHHGFQTLGLARSEAQIEELYPMLVSLYAENLCVHSRLYDGCAAALTALQDAGFALGVCTNKPGSLAVPLLDQLGISQFFGALVAADTLPVRKPDPGPYFEVTKRLGLDVNKSVMIGDSVTDRETARAAGVPCVLVRFGPIGDQVRELDPEHMLGHFSELGALVAEILVPNS